MIPPTSPATAYTSSTYYRSIKEFWDPALAPYFQNPSYPQGIGHRPADFRAIRALHTFLIKMRSRPQSEAATAATGYSNNLSHLSRVGRDNKSSSL